jgi:hypothetical protein
MLEFYRTNICMRQSIELATGGDKSHGAFQGFLLALA